MGYLSRLYVVEKFENAGIVNYYGDNRCFAEIHAMVELGKSPLFRDKIRNYPDASCYIYADDGDTRIIEDVYGEKLKEIPIQDAINIIKECIEMDSSFAYRTCLHVLEAFSDTGFVVLHYGH